MDRTLSFDMNVHPRRVERIKKALSDAGARRDRSGLNQTEYWRKYGVTQSGGSRHENGRGTNRPVQILQTLEELGYISEDDLVEVVCILDRCGFPGRGESFE